LRVTSRGLGDVYKRQPFREPAWRVRALPNGHVVVKFLDENIVRFDEHGKAVAYGSLPNTLDIAMDAARTRMFGSDVGGAVEIDPMTLAVLRRIPAVPPIAELPRAIAVDGRAEFLVAGDKDGVVTAFDATSGKVRWTWRTEVRGEEIRATAISPDGTRAAAVSASGLVMIDCASGNELWHRIDRVHGYRSCVFAPDGSELVASAWSESVDRYDAATGAPVASLLGAFSQVWQSAVSPDGRLIASGTFGTQVEVFDARSSSTLEEIALDDSPVTSVTAVSASGRVFATTASGALFAIDGGRVATRIAIAGAPHANGVCALPSGELAVAHDAGVSWIAQDGRVLRSAETPRPATRVGILANGTVTDARVSSATPGEETLLGFDSATAAPLWSVGRFMANGGVAFETARPGVIYLPRGVGRDSRMFDMRTRDEWVPPTLAEFACCGALSPDGRLAALGCVSRAGEVTLVDGAEFETVAELPNHRGAVRAVRWSPDGTRLASASIDGTVRVWHADRRIEILTAWRGLARDLAWDRDATLWIACEDGKLHAMRAR
jgi:WD40 repeat protein